MAIELQFLRTTCYVHSTINACKASEAVKHGVQTAQLRRQSDFLSSFYSNEHYFCKLLTLLEANFGGKKYIFPVFYFVL